MSNKYLSFISDEHLLSCMSNLYKAYLKSNTIQEYSRNCVDTIKLKVESLFNNIDEEDLLKLETLRQIDKNIRSSIGKFHKEVLCGISGFEIGGLKDFDIKAKDGSTYAIFQFCEIDSKFEDGIFRQLTYQAEFHKTSVWYLVDFYSGKSYCEKLLVATEESSVSHKRVFKISADKFYALLTHEENALKKLNEVLQSAIKDINVLT